MPSRTGNATTTASETYRGSEILLREEHMPEQLRDAGTRWEHIQPAWLHQWVEIDGHSYRRPAGTDEQVLAKLRKSRDTELEDAAMLADLVALVGRPAAPVEELEAPKVGDVAAVYAMGRYRTGHVIKVTKTKATIAYTTASSRGRVFRKAGSFAV